MVKVVVSRIIGIMVRVNIGGVHGKMIKKLDGNRGRHGKFQVFPVGLQRFPVNPPAVFEFIVEQGRVQV